MRGWIAFLVVTLALLPGIVEQLPCAADPPPDADWIISGPEWYSSMTLQLYGNLTILPGGSLKLTKVKLHINSTYDGEFHIEVQPGGELTIEDLDNNPATPDDATELLSTGGGHYLFWVRGGGKLTLRNSIVRDCGYTLGTRGELAGVYLQSSDCEVNGTTFTEDYCGVAVDNCNPRVFNCTFAKNTKYGMYARDTTMTISGNLFDQNTAHGLYVQASQPVLRKNLFRGNLLNGVLAQNSPLTMEANTFQLNKWRGVDADKSPINSRMDEFYQNVAAFYVNDSTVDIESGYFQYNTFCFYLSDARATLRNTTMINTTTYDLNLNRYRDHTEVVSLNTSFTNVTFGDPWSVVCVRWLVTPSVIWDSSGSPVPGALVRIYNNKLLNVYNLTANDTGIAGPLLMTQYEQTKGGKTDPNPFRFGVFSGRYYNSTYMTIDREMAPVLILDDVPPTFTLQGPRDNITTSKETVAVNGTMSSDTAATLTVNGLPVEIDPASGNFSAKVSLMEGPNTINVTATDNVGNVYTLVRTVKRDSTPPNLTINVPEDGLVLNITRFLLKGRTESRTYVKVNGQITDIADDGTFQSQLELAEGENSLAVFSADQYSNGIWLNRTITVDTVPPDVEFLSPENGTWTNKPFIQIAGSTEDGATVRHNGTELELLRGNFSLTVNLTEGDNVLGFLARDRAGNSKLCSILIRRDTSAPNWSITYPADGSYVTTPWLVITGTTEPGVKVVCRQGQVLSGGDGNFTIGYNLTVGQNIVLIELRDPAGNVRPLSFDVYLDLEANLTFRSPANHTRTTQEYLWVEGTAEPGSNLSINMKNATVDNQGNFREMVRLKMGLNVITFNLTDRAGNRGDFELHVMRENPPVADMAGAAVAVLFILVIAAAAGLWYFHSRKERAASAKKLKAPPGEAPERLIFKTPDEPEEKLRCGSCLEPIEEYWATCHNCNSPIKIEDVLERTMDRLVETDLQDERLNRLKAKLAEAHVEMSELRDSGQDVHGYYTELAVAAQRLLRKEKPEKVEATTQGIVKEIGERAARLRATRTQETERAEAELKEQAKVFLDESEPVLNELKAAGADVREIEKMLNMARVQLRAGNLTKGHKYAKKVKKMVGEMHERLELESSQ